ncbi:hypothetical protein [Nocardia sp. CNY236]|uniref:hypothetical protein n=1 Tax=Nocardia sp. CNY236 TaxID=1169152 RepID=UPI00049095AE|nr:hypothetical protein [Nocardia sp. CNY236]
MSTLCGTCERPVSDGLTLCEVCGRSLVEALLGVPGLVADLEIARTGQARFGEGRAGRRPAEATLPIKDTSTEYRGRGVRLLGEREHTALATALHGWARVLADHLGVEIPIGARSLAVLAANARHAGGSSEVTVIVREDRPPNGARVARRTAAHLITPTQEAERLAVWLACHPHELRQLEAADEVYRDITGGTEYLRRVIDRPADRKYLGRCPIKLDSTEVCDTNLWAEPGSTWVRCPACQQQHQVTRLEDGAAVAAREMLCTMPELLHACAAVGSPIARRTGYRWAAQGRLARRAWLIRTRAGVRITDRHEDGAVPVYRVGDALELAHDKPAGRFGSPPGSEVSVRSPIRRDPVRKSSSH